MEEELARLQAQNTQLSKTRSEREVDANDSRAKLHAAEEKVHLCVMVRPGALNSHVQLDHISL